MMLSGKERSRQGKIRQEKIGQEKIRQEKIRQENPLLATDKKRPVVTADAFATTVTIGTRDAAAKRGGAAASQDRF